MMATSLDMNDGPGVIGPGSQIADSLVAELQKLNLTFNEAKILLFLMTHKNACASDISKHTRIQRTDTYGYISSLLSKGIIFSTFDRPQKYYSLSMQEVIDCLVQTKQSELNLLSTKKKEYQEMVDRMVNASGSFPGMKDSYQVIMGENSLNAKIKRMLVEAKEEITVLLSERNLINLYHAGIIDNLIELSGKETHVRLLTTCKNAVYYITNDNGEVCTSVSLKTLAGDIPVNFVLVDNKQIVLLLESPGTKKQELCGFYTNNASLVSAFDFVFSTGNSFGLPK